MLGWLMTMLPPCTQVGRASDSMIASTLSFSFKLVCAGASCLLLGPPGFNWCFSSASDFSVIRRPGISIVGQLTEYVSPRF